MDAEKIISAIITGAIFERCAHNKDFRLTIYENDSYFCYGCNQFLVDVRTELGAYRMTEKEYLLVKRKY